MAQWHTYQTLLAEWPEGGSVGQDVLEELLDVAKLQVLAFAPALTDDVVPDNYRYAQRLQTMALWNASRTAPGEPVDGYQVRVFPMDWQVKNVLRPARGMPVIG